MNSTDYSTYLSYVDEFDNDVSLFSCHKLLHDVTDGPLGDSIMEGYSFLQSGCVLC